jgi:hypothetical protein
MVGQVKAAAVAALVGLIASTATASPGVGWNDYLRPASGFRIAAPMTWHDVPRTAAGIQRRIAELKAKKQDALAEQYASVLADPYTRKNLTNFAFNAFLWPSPPGPISTDVSVRVNRVGNVAVGPATQFFAKQLKDQLKGPGTKFEPVRIVQLPAGRAGLIRGVTTLDPSYGGAKSSYTLYLLVHAGRFYYIFFRTDSRYERRQRSTFEAIARTFGYL